MVAIRPAKTGYGSRMATAAHSFQRESEMTSLALQACSRWWGARREADFVAGEIVGPDAIADLVAVRFNHARLRLRQEHGVGPTTDALALRVLVAARRRPVTTADLATACRVSPSGVRRAISLAIDNGSLIREGKTSYRTHPAWGPGTERTVAVELKLQDWGGALQQARAYSRWAHAAWVVVGRTPPQPALTSAAEQGIGLGVLAPTGAFTRLVRPTSQRWGSLRFAALWTGEQTIARAQSAGLLGLDSIPGSPRAERATPADALAVNLLSA
jgi:hypothetical protein